MNNIRKLKKKKMVGMLNPEELAQQKLFEISRFQDQEAKVEEADLFLESGFAEEKPMPTRRVQKFERSSSQINPETRRPHIPSISSLNNFKKKSSELRNKQQLPLTHYIVIDQRDNLFFQGREKTARYDLPNLIRQKSSTRKIKVRSVPIASRSYELQRQNPMEHVKSLRGNIVYAIQVKNAKLFNKYPSFMDY